MLAPAAAATAPWPQSCHHHRCRRLPSHPSSKKIPRRESAQSSSRSASAADALRRRAPVLASVSRSTRATPLVVVGLGRDSCGALRASRARMPARRRRRLRLSPRRANDSPLPMASGPRQGHESWSCQFKLFHKMRPHSTRSQLFFFFSSLIFFDVDFSLYSLFFSRTQPFVSVDST